MPRGHHRGFRPETRVYQEDTMQGILILQGRLDFHQAGNEWLHCGLPRVTTVPICWRWLVCIQSQTPVHYRQVHPVENDQQHLPWITPAIRRRNRSCATGQRNQEERNTEICSTVSSATLARLLGMPITSTCRTSSLPALRKITPTSSGDTLRLRDKTPPVLHRSSMMANCIAEARRKLRSYPTNSSQYSLTTMGALSLN